MKSKLFIPGLLISIALLTVSCTNDEYEIQENKTNQLKIEPNQLRQEVNGTVIDSTIVNTPNDGEPNNPKPPRT
jgi:hypothetical protein